MADVRSLLRQERAARQQSGRPHRQSAAPAAAPVSKKRKAVGDAAQERKKTRTAATPVVPADFFDGGDANADAAVPAPSAPETTATIEKSPVDNPSSLKAPVPLVSHPHATEPSADDAELEAFMREIEEAPVQPRIQDTYAGVVAEAAPMTAAEIAAQAREEQSAQRGKREEELEAEKDDAARLLEDEFEEMEGLEERVRKLREKREALRTAHAQTYTAEVAVPEPPPAEEDESESEDEDWDDWRFRPA